MKIENNLLIALSIAFGNLKIKVSPFDGKLNFIAFTDGLSIGFSSTIESDLNFVIEDSQGLMVEIDNLMEGEQSEIEKVGDQLFLNGVGVKTSQRWVSPLNGFHRGMVNPRVCQEMLGEFLITRLR